VVLLAAVVVGALAAIVVWNYVNAADDRATGQAAQVEVWAIKKDIPRGTTGAIAIDEEYIVQDEIPTRFKPNSAVVDLETIRTFVAVTDIPANSVLVDRMFVSKEAASTGNAELLKDGKVAITITVDPVRGVAGLVVPGDFVNILVTGDPAAESADLCSQVAAAGEEPPPELITPIEPPQKDRILFCTPAHYLFQKVQVLFVDKTTIPQPGAAPPDETATDGTAPTIQSGLITFAVPPQAAQYIASVPAGAIYLTLVGPDYTPIALPPMEPFPVLLPGEDPTQLTPYGPTGLQPD
jgi:Flp pilus assembly protein CpaB